MKSYKKPVLNIERFTANEFVAACGDSGTTYLFDCNAPKGTLYYYPWSDGNIDGNYTGNGKSDQLGGYKPCHDKHKAESTGDFYEGFVDYNNNKRQDGGEAVIVWLEKGWLPIVGEYTKDYHATTKLNMQEWETAKS